MKKNTLFKGILAIVIGLLLVFWPKGCISIVVAIMGIEAVVNGIYTLVYTRKYTPDVNYQRSVTFRGVLSIVIGLLAFFLPILVAGVVAKFVCYLIGFYLLISAVIQGYAMGMLREVNVDRSRFFMEIVLSILAAIIFFVLPVNSVGSAFVRIAGIIFLIFGACTIFVEYKKKPDVHIAVGVVDDISGTID